MLRPLLALSLDRQSAYPLARSLAPHCTAHTHTHTRTCPSVRPPARPSVRPSVSPRLLRCPPLTSSFARYHHHHFHPPPFVFVSLHHRPPHPPVQFRVSILSLLLPRHSTSRTRFPARHPASFASSSPSILSGFPIAIAFHASTLSTPHSLRNACSCERHHCFFVTP